jgi:hypothetical protein
MTERTWKKHQPHFWKYQKEKQRESSKGDYNGGKTWQLHSCEWAERGEGGGAGGMRGGAGWTRRKGCDWKRVMGQGWKNGKRWKWMKNLLWSIFVIPLYKKRVLMYRLLSDKVKYCATNQFIFWSSLSKGIHSTLYKNHRKVFEIIEFLCNVRLLCQESLVQTRQENLEIQILKI